MKPSACLAEQVWAQSSVASPGAREGVRPLVPRREPLWPWSRKAGRSAFRARRFSNSASSSLYPCWLAHESLVAAGNAAAGAMLLKFPAAKTSDEKGNTKQ